MNKRDTFTATYIPGATGIWWTVARNGVLADQGCAPTRRVAERDASDAIARAQGRAITNIETRSAS